MKNIISIALFLFPVLLLAQEEEIYFTQVGSLVFSQPVDISTTYIVGDNRLFICEKNGRIMIIDDAESPSPKKLSEAFMDITSKVNPDFEGGLLGLAFHPEFEKNGKLYVNYTFNDANNGNKFTTRVSEFLVDPADNNKVLLNSEKEVISVAQPAKNHNGGDLAFGPDGYLYIPLGDGGGSNDLFKNGQNRLSLLGKILRIDINTSPYSIPADNPFVNDDFTLDEIWTLGWRNPWRMNFDRLTGDMWVADVGQDVIEEIDFEKSGIAGGLNYGWSCKEGTQDFNGTQCEEMTFVDPVYEYDHSKGQKSVTGGFVYRGTDYPALYGKYIFTDFEDSRVYWLTEQIGDEFETERMDLSTSDYPKEVATFGESSRNELYVASFDKGTIWKIGLDEVVGIDKLKSSERITIFPNPGKERIYIESGGEEIEEVHIIDMEGRKSEIKLEKGNWVDVSKLNMGRYVIEVLLGGGKEVVVFVKGE